ELLLLVDLLVERSPLRTRSPVPPATLPPRRAVAPPPVCMPLPAAPPPAEAATAAPAAWPTLPPPSRANAVTGSAELPSASAVTRKTVVLRNMTFSFPHSH